MVKSMRERKRKVNSRKHWLWGVPPGYATACCRLCRIAFDTKEELWNHQEKKHGLRRIETEEI